MDISMDQCVDIRLKPSCGYIHGYYAGAPEYLYALSLHNIALSVVFTLHFLLIYVTESNE